MKEEQYWLKKPKPHVLKRILEIRNKWTTVERTVRNICYKLYPGLKGKELDRKYNTTVKDVVRGRVLYGIPWENIRESRVKFVSGRGWKNPKEYIEYYEKKDISVLYSKDKTPSHKCYFEVWYEKDTVSKEFAEICNKYDIPYLCCRGKLTWTAKKKASERLDKNDVVLYFGDNDKPGKDGFNDMEFCVKYVGGEARFLWVAITDKQEQKYGLPEGSRIDGLDENDLKDLIESIVLKYIDLDTYNLILEQENEENEYLRELKIKIVRGDSE